MATRPKAVIESRNGEKFSPITIAKNVLTDDGQSLHDILSDRKEDMMTPTIENSSSMFKVGQGDNVDYSSNVVNGAYENMVLKGKTMVNCIQEPSSQDVVLPYEFADGQYVTINDTKESGALCIELKGQTLVNLLGELVVDLNNNPWSEDENNYILDLATGNGQPILSFRTLYTLPANKTYTLFINMTSYVTGVIHIDFRTPSNTSSSSNQRYFGEAGWQKLVFTTTEETAFVRMFNRNGMDNTYSISKSLILLEGDHTNTPIPNYFTGMASCKMPTLHTVGKNLFDLSNASNGFLSLDKPYVLQSPDQNNKTSAYIKVKPNTKYSYSFDGFTPSQVGGMYWTGFYYYKKIGEVSTVHPSRMTFTSNSEANKQLTFTTPSDCNYIRIGSRGLMLSGATVQLEEATSATAYESYKSSILSLPEEIVLRSLPNGVCDTFNTRTGEYVQRIGEVTLTGGESFVRESNAQYNRFQYKNSGCITQSQRNPINSNTFVSVTEAAVHRNQMGFVYGGTIYLYSPVGPTQTVEEFKTWLQDNPTTIQYQLAKSVVTKINLPSTLKSWNSTTHIYSEIPENTLYPILSHSSNPTYPVILKPSTKYSIVANSYSNNHINSAINFNLGGATASATVGNRVTTITTPSTLSNELLTMSGRGNKLNNVMVIEGDVVGDEPYFEGICDCKSPILLNCGKNLFNTPYFDNMDNLLNNTDAYVTYKVKTIKLKPNTVYTFSHEGGELKSNIWSVFNIEATSENKIITTIYNIKNWSNTTHQKISPLQRTFKSPSDGVIHLSCYSKYKASGEVYDRFTEDGMFTRVLKNIQLEETSTSTQYKPYKSNTTTFNQKDDKTIVLRSLPNGVCDTLNVETGEYVQRIGEVVLDGTKRFGKNMPESEYNKPCVRVSCGSLLVNGSNAPHFNMKADKIAIGHYSYDINYPVMAGLYEQALYIYIPRTIIGLTANDNDAESIANAFNNWLAQNPITVQYPLATPVVSTIDIQGFPHAYTNGHVQLSSGHSGQSLTPKVEYSVVTNRNGQIRNNQKMVERHQKQLDRLQAMILTNLVNTQYEQTLTNLKYDLKNVREEVK